MDSADEDEMLQIKIGSKSFEFNLKDEIFFRVEPAPPHENETSCTFSEKQLTEKDDSVFCQFCGHLFAKEFAKKQRKFKGSDLKGVCCKICDRKFVQR